jgi:hypothetical protein
LPRRTRHSGEAIPRAVRGATLPDTSTPIWYVTFEVRQRGILPRQRSPRETRTFATEAEAKIFARSKFDEGLVVYAGTINPHTPKRLVPTSQIDSWLADAPIDDESTYGEKDESTYGEKKE